jgi:hypothetical protein
MGKFYAHVFKLFTYTSKIGILCNQLLQDSEENCGRIGAGSDKTR